MKLNKIFLSILILILIVSCKSTETETITEEPSEPVIEEVIETEEETLTYIEDEAVPEEIEEDVEVIEDVVVEEIDDVEDVEDVEFIDDINDEYLRSIGDIETEEEISQQEFEDDKSSILQIISELSVIMEEKDVNSWLPYIDPASKKYYSNPANLRKAQKKLPNKLIVLKNIGDYFVNIFIPARQISRVDEIRYISKTEVKAVEVKEDGNIVVYYFFKKINDKWYINLPPL